MGAGHKSRFFLVANLNKLEKSLVAFKGTKDAINPITWKTIDEFDLPFSKTLQQKIAHIGSHKLFARFPLGIKP
jgi:hypothetical protein